MIQRSVDTQKATTEVGIRMGEKVNEWVEEWELTRGIYSYYSFI
jgi:hypothetical protein